MKICQMTRPLMMRALMMRSPKMRTLTLIAAGLMLLGAAPVAWSGDSLFTPRVYVNNRAVTEYELSQRVLFMQLLRAPGTSEDLALKNLIEDRLELTVAAQMGLKITPEQIKTGMDEFSGRANLTTDKFVEALAQAGVDQQTFRDFVAAGVAWREVVRAKFGPLANVTDVEVDRALADAGRKPAVRVLVSELVLPAPAGQEADALAAAAGLKASIHSEAEFSAAARSQSAAASAVNGGRLDWMPLANLPPAIAPFVLALAPGAVSDPVQIPGAVAVFQLRGIQDMAPAEPSAVTVDYAQFLVANDANAESELARIRAKVDTCADLYGLALGLPAERLLRDNQPMAAVPPDIGLELARLDPGESSAGLVRGGARVFLMLCARTYQQDPPPTREAIRAQLVNQRMAGYADTYLADLRANAIIRQP